MNDKSNIPAIEGGTPVRDEPLPFFRAPITEADIDGVVETLRSGWLTVGPRTVKFEEELARYLEVDHAIAVSSCSAAMFVSLKALGVQPGDEVITSALTFASTVHAIIHAGATPVLADIEAETLGPNPDHMRELVSDKTSALMPVHFGGQPCRIEEICAVATDAGLGVVEDAAHSFGARSNGKMLGGFGDTTTFSFYATKNLTTAEGGAITTNDAELAAKLRLLAFHGMNRDSWSRYADRGSWYYEVELPGYKCNLNDIQASLGLTQLARIDELHDQRRAVAAELSARLQGVPYFELPAEREHCFHTWHLFVLQLNLDSLRISRDEFINALTEENIGSSVHFIPIHKHPFYQPFQRENATYPVCDDYFSRCISLPIYPSMEASDVDAIVEALTKIATYYRAG